MSKALQSTRSLAYGQVERRLVSQASLVRRDYLWKVYTWGSHHDEALMSRLDIEPTLSELLDPDAVKPGFGYQRGTSKPSLLLRRLPSLKVFEPWGAVLEEWLEAPPSGVKRQPDEGLYTGYRLLARRGVKAGFGPRVRLEDADLSFRHHTYGIPLQGVPKWKAELVYGILLSSLGRYRVFMTSGSWGVWHDSVVAGDILRIPVPDGARTDPAVVGCIRVVNRIRKWVPRSGSSMPTALLHELDDAVYELFGLTSGERDLVEDWKNYKLPVTQGNTSSETMRAFSSLPPDGIVMDLEAIGRPLRDYVETFVAQWNSELKPDAELSWALVRNSEDPIVAALFETREPLDHVAAPPLPTDGFDRERWHEALHVISDGLTSGNGRRLAVDGTVRAVGESYMIVIKRDEARLWSASAAREDFEATLLQAINLRES
jgi:hypothetical protein